MKYEIKGGELPVVVCFMDAGETMITEKGSMSWMSPNMKMETTSNGGVGKALGRMFAGEAIFQNRYTAEGGQGMIAFASSFPGQIRPWEIAPGKEIVVQKAGFLAAQESVELSIFFQKKLGSGLFGGEGFIMQKISGHGLAFLEFDGSVIEYVLQPGQQIVVDTGYLAAMEATCNMEIRTVPGIKNMMFGGEGLFNAVITGPGRVWLQTMPISNVAGAIMKVSRQDKYNSMLYNKNSSLAGSDIDTDPARLLKKNFLQIVLHVTFNLKTSLTPSIVSYVRSFSCQVRYIRMSFSDREKS